MMNIELSSLLLTAASYLLCIFGLAYITEKGWLSSRLINHPVIYVLSLGVSISTWSFYTAIVAASTRGYGYSAYYIGYASAFMLAPIVLQPILQITRTYQLSSMADLFAFRFRSPWAGTLTTIVLLLCIFPLFAIQLIALSSSVKILIPNANIHLLAFIFCVFIALFTILFGARDISGRDKHQGLVIAMAFESAIKFIILMGLGLYAVFEVFGGFDALDIWLRAQPPETTRLDIPLFQNSTNLIILLFFTAAITMPHMFHMVFRENSNPSNLKIARWGFPLYLLMISLPALPILWAAEFLNSDISVQFSAIAIGLITESNLVTYAIFLGGIAGCFGVSVVIAMAVSGMCINHLLLPLHKPDADGNLYSWLTLLRQAFIALILLGGFITYFFTSDTNNITDVSYVSLIACAQFLPGILTLLYWPNGNSKGFIAGLIAGVTAWLLLGLIPMFTNTSITQLSFSAPTVINWNLVASISLLSNIIVLIAVSLFSKTSDEERSAGRMCSMDTLRRPQRMNIVPKTPAEFIILLSEPLGEEAAKREVQQALEDLNINEHETRPFNIQKLREQIEANLSGLLGPTIAYQMIARSLPYERRANNETSLDLGYIEQSLENYPGNLSGVSLDLDKLRRHHRQMLQDLPIGVCSLNSNQEIVNWNIAMEQLTGMNSDSIIGTSPESLDDPWGKLLIDFLTDTEITHIPKKAVLVAGKQHWLSLHKANIDQTRSIELHNEGLVIVIEDLTETAILESSLVHSERLASIGRLAAGVAHEIGNPITGIACLAQNIRDESTNPELRFMAEQIIEQTKRTSRIVQSLVNFSHSGTAKSKNQLDSLMGDRELEELVSVHNCVNEAIQLISLDKESDNIQFINDCSQDSKVFSDNQRLQQILLNLLSNARDASHTGAIISVTDSINEKQLSIIVTDEGEGIPESLQDQIFEPFFTTKDPGKGTGLGLTLVYSITKDLGGLIDIISPIDKVSKTGTRVIVTFPCYDGEST